MVDFDVVAYAMLGLSLLVSAAQIGAWLLQANPRAILNAGRLSAVGLSILTPLILLWLVASGRSTLAMMLAAFVLPVFIEGARRWRGWVGLLDGLRKRVTPRTRPRVGGDTSRTASPGTIDPRLAEQCAALIKAYLEQTALQVAHQPSGLALANGVTNGSANGTGHRRMSAEEALQVLGLDATASAREIREAYCRLEERLAPESGGTDYLAAKISEARDVLLRA